MWSLKGFEAASSYQSSNIRMAKRSLGVEEFEDVSEVANPSPNAKIRGVVTSMSPMKKGRTCNYFDGEITDGKTSMRLFGFDSAAGVRRKLMEFEGKAESVTLSKCEVKRARQGTNLEILLGKYTDVQRSDKAFSVESVVDKKNGKRILLNELPDLMPYERVSVAVKALRVEDPMEVTGGKRKQDIIIGDSSATTRLTVWEKEIGSIEVKKSYQLHGMVVKEYRGTRCLSTSKDNAHIAEIDDIGAVNEEDMGFDEESSNSDVKNARIVGVDEKDSYPGCIRCNAKVIQDIEDEDLGKCVKCQMTQCIDVCAKQFTIRVVIKADGKEFTLRAFGRVVSDIVQKSLEDDVTEGMLLKAQPFSFHYSGGIIQSIRR